MGRMGELKMIDNKEIAFKFLDNIRWAGFKNIRGVVKVLEIVLEIDEDEAIVLLNEWMTKREEWENIK